MCYVSFVNDRSAPPKEGRAGKMPAPPTHQCTLGSLASHTRSLTVAVLIDSLILYGRLTMNRPTENGA